MNRIRLLAIGTMLIFGLTTVAQQTTTKPGGPGNGLSGGVSGGVHGGDCRPSRSARS
jgi:hypothetical protein